MVFRITVLLIFFLSHVICALAQRANLPPNELLNKPCPDFELKTLEGQLINKKELSGDVIVLNFWFTGCIPCLNEIRQLNHVAEKYESKGIHFIAITWENDVEMLRKFSRLKAMRYKVVIAERDIINRFHFNMYPTSVVIDQAGIVRFFESGFYGDVETKLDKEIKSLIK